jgi:hypothetical protein
MIEIYSDDDDDDDKKTQHGGQTFSFKYTLERQY